ncbi:MAG TPA: PAS domain S-box protein [Methylocella sp.]|nr:PAS domain S-box protein [Methylocella sp.]
MSKLRIDNQIYRLMVESILDCAIFMLDVDGSIMTWNSGAEEITGYCSAEIIGRHFSVLYPREDARSGKPEKELLASVAENRLSAESARLRKDGSRFWAQTVITPVRDEDELLGFVTMIKDVTQQKHAQDELRRGQERFQRAVEAAPNAMLMVNRAGRIEMLNLQTEWLFGYARDELLGQPIEKLIPPRFRAHHRQDRMSYFADPKPRPMGAGRDLYALTKDGLELPVEIGLNPIETDQGTVVLVAIVDLTERKQREEALLRSQGRFQRALESAPNAMVMASRRGRIEMANLQAERLFGYARDELLGQSVEALIPERFRQHHPKLRAAFSTNPVSRPMGAGRDLFALRKDGSEFPVEIGLNPIETDEGLMVLAAIVDITDRKRKEEELRCSQERFRGAIEGSPTALIMVSHQGRIEMMNHQAEQIFGYSRDELLGQPIERLVPERLRNRHPEFRASFFANPEPRPMDGGRGLYGLRKDGSEFPVEIGLNPVRTENGIVVIAAIADITSRKQKEERIAAALKEKDVLLNEVHHRVKNNLQIVTSILHLQSAKIKDQAALAVLQDCESRIKSMALIHQMLYESNDFAEVNFGHFLQSLAAALEDSYDIDPNRIGVSINAEAVHLPLDTAIPCGQIVGELITNSFKHAFPEGRRGSIAVVLTKNAEGEGVLSVTDDGIGIPSGVDITSPATLGLRLVSVLADQLRGSLSLQRANPTQFVLQFPL